MFSVALFNDTGRTPHVGCLAVSSAHLKMLARAGAELREVFSLHEFLDVGVGNAAQRREKLLASVLPDVIRNVDAVVVNGEGTIHHQGGKNLVEILRYAQDMGRPTFLVNAVIQDCAEHKEVFLRLNDFTVRDAQSSRYLKELGVPHRLVPDSILEADFLPQPSVDWSGKIVVMDYHADHKGDVGAAVQHVREQLGDRAVYFPLEGPERMQDWRHAVANLRTARAVLSPRHHGNYLAWLAGVPFVALGYNTWKVEGFLEMIGSRQELTTDPKRVLARLEEAAGQRDEFARTHEKIAAQLPLATFQGLEEYIRNSKSPPPAKKSADWLLLPTGVAQLLIMVAWLRNAGEESRGAQVLSVIGVFNEPMRQALQQTCDLFGLHYAGNFIPTIQFQGVAAETLSPADRNAWEADPATWISRRLLAQHPALQPFAGRAVITTARPGMPEDFALLTALAPRRTILVADGIQNDAVLHQRTGGKWRGGHPDLACFPTRATVWCPDYLARDTQGIGQVGIIPAETNQAGLAELGASPLGQQLQRQAVPHGTVPRSIILSQHFALSRLCSPAEEIYYYLQIIEHLRRRQLIPILFKRHPRDPVAKTRALEKLIGLAAPGELLFTDDLAACVPIEAITSLWKDTPPVVVGSSSSALLGLRQLAGFRICCADATYLPAALRKQVILFSAKHDIPVFRLEANFPSVVATAPVLQSETGTLDPHWLAAQLRLQGAGETRTAQLFFHPKGHFNETDSRSLPYPVGRWSRLTFSGCVGQLRFDPAAGPGGLQMAGICIRTESDRRIVWFARRAKDLAALRPGGDARKQAHPRLFALQSTGADPQVLIPVPRLKNPEARLLVTVWLRADPTGAGPA